MQAAVLTAPGQIEIREVDLPRPGPGQVRVRLEGCGVCASNLGPWGGLPWTRYPGEPGELGHEGWGRVEAVGPDVVHLRPGDRVATLSHQSYAEQDIASVEQAILLPEELDSMAFPGEPLGCAMNILARSDIAAGQTVAIVGIGFLGALLTRLAANAGAHVIAISRRPFARDLAVRMGAAATVGMDSHEAVLAEMRGLTDGRLCDRVIEAVGLQWPLDLAAEMTRERGRLIIAGYHQDGARQVNMQLWNWRGLDVVNAHERDPAVYAAGVRAAIAAIARGEIDPLPLFTHRYPLEELGMALDMTRDRPDGFLKALVTF